MLLCCYHTEEPQQTPSFRPEDHRRHYSLRGDSELRSSTAVPGGLQYRSLSRASSDSGYGRSTTEYSSSDAEYSRSSRATSTSGYRGPSTRASATYHTSSLVKQFQKVKMPPTGEESKLSAYLTCKVRRQRWSLC